MRSKATVEPVLAEETQISVVLDDLTGKSRNLPAVWDNYPLCDYYSAIALFCSSGLGVSWG